MEIIYKNGEIKGNYRATIVTKEKDWLILSSKRVFKVLHIILFIQTLYFHFYISLALISNPLSLYALYVL